MKSKKVKEPQIKIKFICSKGMGLQTKINGVYKCKCPRLEDDLCWA